MTVQLITLTTWPIKVIKTIITELLWGTICITTFALLLIKYLRQEAKRRASLYPRGNGVLILLLPWTEWNDLFFSGCSYPIAGTRRDGKELVQCPTPGCDGMGHSTGNYATHRRSASNSYVTSWPWVTRFRVPIWSKNFRNQFLSQN